MRNLVLDFEFTVLGPLMMLVLGSLWHASRQHLAAKRALRNVEPTIINQAQSGSLDVGLVEILNQNQRAKWQSADWLQYSICALVFLVVAMGIPDPWKLRTAYLAWKVLWLASTASLIAAIPSAWHYAKKADWPKVGLCLLITVLAATSAKHFFYQSINADHAICPHCKDDSGEDK